ncbi:uncharacterized protein LOC126672339 [Mercurialis annua]|uniref:uncharacterized protein LOC126672339 n=1 Tax=Mercurialis annua TaxID=3986 RepID=UPI00215FCC21|nr:uncharacterized protein LOC126672339 [Mercurialis annua]
MAPYEAFYGCKWRSSISWEEVSEHKLSGAEIIQITSEKVGDYVSLRVLPMKCVARFGVKGKLEPRYVGSYEITERVEMVAYRLALSPDMSLDHLVFYVTLLRKCISDLSHVIVQQSVKIDQELSYEEQLVEVVDKQVRK